MSYFKKAFALMAVVAISTTDLFAYNVTIGDGGTECPAVSGNTITATEDCSISVETIQTALASGNLAINTGNTGGDGNIYVNSEIEWSTANSLYLDAFNNIYINKSITATNDNGKLALFYGRGAANADNTSDYFINAPINLKAGDNFITILGSNGAMTTWTVVTTASDLQSIALGGNSVLGADVDISSISNWTPIGNSTTKFTGNFDGLGHIVDNLTITSSSVDSVGLFSETKDATIKNLGLTNANISVDKKYVGGIVGKTDSTTIENTYFSGSITTSADFSYVGGLVGYNSNSKIKKSYTEGTVNVTGNAAMGNGGLVGYNRSASLIEDSYSLATVTGKVGLGGLVGNNYGSTIKNSYASGVVNPQFLSSSGGLVYENTGGTIENSYYDNETNTKSMGNTDYGKTKAEIVTALSSLDAWTAGGDSVEGYSTATSLTLPQLVAFYTSSGEILFAGGFGTEADPYEITNWNQLQNINHSNILTQGYYFSLLNNLGSSTDGYTTQVKDGTTLANSGTGWNPIGSQYSTFTGSFDGLGHTVDALTIDNSTSSYQGLFGAVKTGSNIKNVGVTNVNIKGKIRVGALAGNNQGNISNAYSTGTVVGTGAYAGGLVGRNSGSVENSYSLAAATSSIQIGGLVGQNTGTISNSYASSSVASSDNSDTVGGLTNNFGGTVTNSWYDNGTNTATMADSDTYGKTTAELKNLALDNWDIETYTATENTYPTLAWQESENNFTSTWIIGIKPSVDINISNNTLAENNSADAIIGTLSTINSDTGDTFTYSLCGGVDDASFSITTNELQANAVFDYESKNSYEVCVRTTDSANATFDKNITISITNVNEMPSISGTATTSVDEESAYSYTLGASDADGDSLTWSVKSGTSLPNWLSISNGFIVSTFAGSSSGSSDGVGTDASFNNPEGVAVDSNNNIYVADYNNNKIRKITSDGVVSTFAGSGSEGSTDGIGIAATFDSPRDIVIDSDNNLYVADTGNNKIRKITPDGTVTTFAGSGTAGFADDVGTAAAFITPSGIAMDSNNNIYVADTFNHKIRKITPDGTVTTFAGSGTAGFADDVGTNAQFNQPFGVAVDSDDNVYVADKWNNKIRKITPDANVTTFAGSGNQILDDGVGTAASFYRPGDITIDSNDNIYVADSWNNSIRKITPDANVTTLAGTGNDAYGFLDGFGTEALFGGPTGITLDSDNNIYVADYGNHKIRKITQSTTLSGTPTNDEVGDHNISLVVSDGTNEVEHNFTITVTGLNSAPTASNFTYTTDIEDSAKTFNWKTLSNAADSDGTIASASIHTNGTKGTATISADSITYTPATNKEGSDTIVITITDSGGATVNITITVQNINTFDATADDDNDGISNVDEGITTSRDSDGDGTPDYLDTDSDNDGKSDKDEGLSKYIDFELKAFDLNTSYTVVNTDMLVFDFNLTTDAANLNYIVITGSNPTDNLITSIESITLTQNSTYSQAQMRVTIDPVDTAVGEDIVSLSITDGVDTIVEKFTLYIAGKNKAFSVEKVSTGNDSPTAKKWYDGGNTAHDFNITAPSGITNQTGDENTTVSFTTNPDVGTLNADINTSSKTGETTVAYNVTQGARVVVEKPESTYVFDENGTLTIENDTTNVQIVAPDANTTTQLKATTGTTKVTTNIADTNTTLGLNSISSKATDTKAIYSVESLESGFVIMNIQKIGTDDNSTVVIKIEDSSTIIDQNGTMVNTAKYGTPEVTVVTTITYDGNVSIFRDGVAETDPVNVTTTYGDRVIGKSEDTRDTVGTSKEETQTVGSNTITIKSSAGLNTVHKYEVDGKITEATSTIEGTDVNKVGDDVVSKYTDSANNLDMNVTASANGEAIHFLKKDTDTVKATSKIIGAKTTMKETDGKKQIVTKVSTTTSLNKALDIEVTANDDATVKHKMSLKDSNDNSVEVVANFNVKGATTQIEQDGSIETNTTQDIGSTTATYKAKVDKDGHATHIVDFTNGSLTGQTTVTSQYQGAITTLNTDGIIETNTTSGTMKAVVRTTVGARSKLYFYNNGTQVSLYNSDIEFPQDSNITIKEIDGVMSIETIVPLEDNLKL